MDRREFIKVAGGSLLAGTACAYGARMLAPSVVGEAAPPSGKKWGMVIDLGRCSSDCDACLVACREENNVYAAHEDPRYDIHWIRKVSVTSKVGVTHQEKSVPLLCNHCEHPPCAQVCPVQATYKRHDGIVIVDHHRCVGCRYCMIACPYNARFFNFKDSPEEFWPNKDFPKRSHGVAEACTLCAHRLDRGRLPACVEACRDCGAGAIIVGDLNDRTSEISELIANRSAKRIREDLGTEPKVWYLGL